MRGPLHIADTADTSAEARAVQLALQRRTSPLHRLRQTFAWSRQIKNMTLDALRRQHPDWEEGAIRRQFIKWIYGLSISEAGSCPQEERTLGELDDLVDALSPVVNAFRELGICHYVGGSVASSFHGATRSTMDVDLISEMTEPDIVPFIHSIGTEFYASESAILDAVRRRGCFNLIHLPTSFKVDVFVSRRRPFDIESMQRATMQRLGIIRFVELRIATVEDSIISKLEWYRLSNETSERQWDDVARLLDIQGADVDRAYLRRAAELVGVEDLLDCALEGR